MGGTAEGGNFGGPWGRAPWPQVHGRALGDEVALFLSTYVNKVDRKGRVSVPATFRASLSGQSFQGIVAFRSFKYPTLDASGIDRMEDMTARLDRLDEFSEERDNLSWLFADAQQLPFDPEGRIILPERLVEHAFITESAAFVGLGRTFQIWEPGRFEEHQAAQRERARREGARLPPIAGGLERRPE
jgi:MraZ protein